MAQSSSSLHICELSILRVHTLGVVVRCMVIDFEKDVEITPTADMPFKKALEACEARIKDYEQAIALDKWLAEQLRIRLTKPTFTN